MFKGVSCCECQCRLRHVESMTGWRTQQLEQCKWYFVKQYDQTNIDLGKQNSHGKAHSWRASCMHMPLTQDFRTEFDFGAEWRS